MPKNRRNIYVLIAGFLCAITSLVHIIAGQLDLVNPLLESNLSSQAKTEWLSVWHIVSVILCLSSLYLVRYALDTGRQVDLSAVRMIGWLFVLFGVVFILCSLLMGIFAPQWILLLPIGLLTLFNSKT